MYRTFVSLLLLLVLVGQVSAENYPTQSTIPTQEGENLSLAGLEGEVTVKYDAFGVPHIYATTDHDLFMVQGYITAQDRWWQMEWSRRQARGELSVLMGESLVGTDRFLRTLGLRANAEADWEIMSDEFKAATQAYSDGINAWLADKTPAEAAIEYTFLAQMGIEITKLEPWQPLDTVIFGQAVALSFSQSYLEYELLKQGLIDAGGSFAPVFLAPGYDYENAPLISEPGRDINLYEMPAEGVSYQAPLQMDTPIDAPNFAALPFEAFQYRGSNSWAVSGDLTDTGKPFLANDPHIDQSNPSVWYEVGLHCVEMSDACHFDSYGYIFPGSVGILIGHNANLGWGMTVSGLDTLDVYLLKINPDDPNQYEYEGEWVDMEIRTETVTVANGDPVEVEVRTSRFGPVINHLLDMEEVFAVKLVAAQPTPSMEVVYWLPRAANWDEFQAGVAKFAFAGQNFMYADAEGNIAVVTGGWIPIRAADHDGSLPVDGSTAAYEWQGFLDPAENPRVVNPEAGYLVAANNAFLRNEDLPTTHGIYYDYGFRATRIERLLQAEEVHTVATMQAIQNDTFNPAAAITLPALTGLTFEEPDLEAAKNWLADWDMMNDADSGQAALFNAFWLKLMPIAFDEMAPAGGVNGGTLQMFIMREMAGQDYLLWGNEELGTSDWAEQMKLAFAEGYAMMVELQGENPDTWRWDTVHVSPAVHVPFGDLPRGISPELDALAEELATRMNRPIPVNGGMESVNNQRWDARNGNLEVDGSIVSMRMIVDFSDLDNSQFVHELGQSGNPDSPHYDDMSPLWATSQYHPHGFTPDGVEALTETTVVFTPAE